MSEHRFGHVYRNNSDDIVCWDKYIVAELDMDNIDNNKVYFGCNCKHGMWYNNLNDDNKWFVLSNLKFIYSKYWVELYLI